MPELPTDLLPLALVVFGLGMRHGFDPDHLAAIDGLTRCNAVVRPQLARYCGALFALGHGAVIVAVAALVNVLASRWQVPEWLESTGAWISVGFLAALGIVNLHTVLRAEGGLPVPPAGLRAKLLGPLGQAANPALVALVGALFALSFDALSLAALFAWSGAQHGGLHDALLLALLFAFGMVVTDAANGLWVARLMRRADGTAVLVARVMGWAVALASLIVAAIGAARLLWPGPTLWTSYRGAYLSLGLLAMLMTASLLAGTLARRQAVARLNEMR